MTGFSDSRRVQFVKTVFVGIGQLRRGPNMEGATQGPLRRRPSPLDARRLFRKPSATAWHLLPSFLGWVEPSRWSEYA